MSLLDGLMCRECSKPATSAERAIVAAELLRIGSLYFVGWVCPSCRTVPEAMRELELATASWVAAGKERSRLIERTKAAMKRSRRRGPKGTL